MASFDDRNETQVRPEVIAAASASGSRVVAGEIDTRALRAEKRELQAKIDAFFSALKAGQFANDIEAAEEATKTFHGDIDKLKDIIKTSTQNPELNIMTSSLTHMFESVTCAYEQWRKSLVNVPLSTPTPPVSQLEIEVELADATSQPPVVEPCDSASNCSTGTGISNASVASSQLRHQQIEFELEKKQLQAEFEMQQNLAKFNLKMAALEAKEKHLRAASAAGSLLSRSTARSKRRYNGSLLESLTGRANSDNGNRTTTYRDSSTWHERANIGQEQPQQRWGAVEHNIAHENELPISSGDREGQVPRGRSPAIPPTISGSTNVRPHQMVPEKLPARPVAAQSARIQLGEPSHPTSSSCVSPRHAEPTMNLQNNHTFQQPLYYTSTGQPLLNPAVQYIPVSPPYGSNSSLERNQSYQLLLEEAREIRYKGRDLPFIFYFNQITSLLKRCQDPTKKMDLLRASCQDEARLAISAMVPPVPGWDVETQINEALNALRLRYGCASFLAEPLVKQVRSGPKLSRIDTPTLEKLIADLNNCELYARAHKQTSALDSSFILDIGERCPYYFKNKYTDYLLDQCDNPDQPSFESFKLFLNRELKRINTTFAQRFLGLAGDKTDKSRLPAKVRVHQTNFETKLNSAVSKTVAAKPNTRRLPAEMIPSKTLPICFVCSSEKSENRHFLFNCAIYSNLSPQRRQETLLKAERCLNCYQRHKVKDCKQPCKCKHCGARNTQKHATSLHDLYVSHSNAGANHGVAETAVAPARSSHGAAITDPSNQTTNLGVRKVQVKQTGILARISAVRVSNPQTGVNTLVYVQHDPGSQVTLISSALVKELDLVPAGKSHLSLHTLSSSETRQFDHVSFDLEALDTNERFPARKALVIPPWSDEGYTLPHQQDLSEYPHFDQVTTYVIPSRRKVDILLGLDNSALMRVLEERVGQETQPHAIKTPIGWIASGGNFQEDSPESYVAQKVSATHCPVEAEKIAELQETVRLLTMEDEAVQHSINDKKAERLVKENSRVVGNRYEMPVPLKESISTLPNNYVLAAKRVQALRQSMLKKPQLKDALVSSMQELKQNEYIAPAAETTVSNTPINYLPYFLTSQSKPRVVYDGSAAWKGRCINDSIYSGPDLLNRLSHVLARFRLGKYALMLDLSKCFFQILLPQDQQDLFRILWFKNDDIEAGVLEPYRFTRHVWGVISSPFIACYAIRKLGLDNPTGASESAIRTVLNSMYMDDLLFSVNTL